MSGQDYIPDEVFDKTHSFYDDKGSKVSSLRKSSVVPNSNGADADDTLLQSVYLAEGIHHHITEDALEDLPDRVQGGSVKAHLSWFGALCLAGIGMFVEAYLIITTGQIKSIWHAAYPTCWEPDKDMVCPENIQCCGLYPNTPSNADGTCALDPSASDVCGDDGLYKENMLCEESILHSISYSEFAGIMVGMVIFGSLADIIGRNAAGIMTSLCMLGGVTVMAFIDHPDFNTMFIIWSAFFGIFGLGVGGEYPLSASGAAAHHSASVEEAKMEDEERHKLRIMRDHERTARRGETIGCVFAMQGVGAVTGSLFLIVLIYFAGEGRVECDQSVRPGANEAGVIELALSAVWRSFYFIGAIFVFMVLMYRFLIVEEGEGFDKLKQRKMRRKKKMTTGFIFKTYGLRLVGTGGSWLLWDVAFYGLKLFSGPIFAAINPSGDLLVQNGYLLINSLIGLSAYYITAYVIDIPSIGRVKVQAVFFTLVSIIFLAISFLFEQASSGTLIGLYFLSTFLGQFVNTTTYVVAAETFPTELRGTLHGASAFLGKAGALAATITFGRVDTPTIFLICGIVGLAGAVLTVFFSVDLTHVSLSEHDAQLELTLEGRPEEYKGKLNKKEHLSLFERMTGKHGEYDPGWAKTFINEEMNRKKSLDSSTVDAVSVVKGTMQTSVISA